MSNYQKIIISTYIDHLLITRVAGLFAFVSDEMFLVHVCLVALLADVCCLNSLVSKLVRINLYLCCYPLLARFAEISVDL